MALFPHPPFTGACPGNVARGHRLRLVENTDLEQDAAKDCLRDKLDKLLQEKHLDNHEDSSRDACQTHRGSLLQDEHRTNGRLRAREAAKQRHGAIGKALRRQLLVLCGLLAVQLVHDQRREQRIEVAEHGQLKGEHECFHEQALSLDRLFRGNLRADQLLDVVERVEFGPQLGLLYAPRAIVASNTWVSMSDGRSRSLALIS